MAEEIFGPLGLNNPNGSMVTMQGSGQEMQETVQVQSTGQYIGPQQIDPRTGQFVGNQQMQGRWFRYSKEKQVGINM